MSIQGGPDIVENGLILCYDPANIESYVSGSTTMYDLGSTGNTASLVGGVEYTGSFKGIFNFDGLNDYINIARPSSISTSGSFSVCMFAKWKTLGTTTSSIQTLLDNNHSSSPAQGFVIQDRPELSKKLSFSVRPDQVGATSSFYVGNNNWYHIAGTHDGTVTRLYINGVLDGFVSQSGGIATVQPNITFARWQGSGGSRHMRGNIGHSLIYNRSLSLIEVQQNYNAVKGRYPSIAYTPDTNFENVTLLLRGDGENNKQNNTFIDSSTNGFAITRNGNTTQGTFSPYGDNWSNYFDGTGDNIATPSDLAFAFGTGDWTMEFWAFPTAATNNMRLVQFSGDSDNLDTNFGATGRINYYNGAGSTTSANAVVSLSTWSHIALVRSSGTVTVYVNGISALTQSTTPNSTTARICYIGGLGNDKFIGYISNFRIVKGTALYTSNFTPPTSPLTAITNTSLLTCHSNRFRDASSNNFTLTRNGDVSVQRFSPFSPTVAYDARTIGGSGYFDGTADYLTVPYTSSFDWYTPGVDFTVEAWVYANAWTNWSTSGGNPRLVGNMNPIGAASNWTFGPNLNGNLIFRYYSVPGGLTATVTSSALLPNSQWNHIAMTKTTSGITLFINGTVASATTAIISGSQSGVQPLSIGAYDTTGIFAYTINGYVSDLRIVRGTAVYSGNYTVPTAPITSITNTSLLVNFTNAAIIDSAMMGVPETVGNAQISTNIKKYGESSLYFDGDGDWLRVQGTPNLYNLSAGDFTIECWFYPMSVATSAIIQQGTSDWRISYTANTTANGSMRYEVAGNSVSTAVGAFTFNDWNHLAVCKSGSITTVYINGTSRVTSSATPVSSTNPIYIGANIDGGNPFWPYNGYIDDVRVTRGIARYTSNFTPPTITLPDL